MLADHFKCGADAEKNQGERLGPMLVCIAYDDGLLGPMKAFHESVGCGVMSGCPKKVNATGLGQGVEEL
jgi:hypothetical protein